MKEDERELLELLQIRTAAWRVGDQDMPYVRELVEEMDMNQKRAAYILTKWDGKDWYEYGVSVMAGWLTKEGMLVHV